MATQAPGLYRPLDASIPEIRLFILEPSPAADSPLVGHLQTISLDSPPPYEGVSYMWGKPNHTAPITIAGHTLLVTPNLEVALRGLRLRDAQRVLWVDAICINQKSLSERGQQVSLMKTIYSRCIRDLLWLGPLSDVETRSWSPSEENIVQGFRLMKRLVDRDITALEPMIKEWKEHEQKIQKWGTCYFWNEEYLEIEMAKLEVEDVIGGGTESQGAQEKQLDGDKQEREQKGEAAKEVEDLEEEDQSNTEPENPTQHHMLTSEDQRALESAFRYPEVWTRLWVMQELSLAPRVQLVAGSHTLDWDIISGFLGDSPYADAFHGTFSHGHIGSITYNIFEKAQIIDHQRRIMRDTVQKGGESKLFDVLARFRETHCLDPRDKIFGLLGLVTDYKDIQINYLKSPEQVYTDVTATLINHTGNLDIICQSPWHSMQDFRWTRDQTANNRPSWAADFMTKGEVRLFAQRSIFNAGRISCEVPCKVFNESILGAKGVLLGRIGPILQDDYPSGGNGASINERYHTANHLPLEWSRLYLDQDKFFDKESGDQYITGESAFTAFWRTLVVDSAVWPMVRLTPQQIEKEDQFLRETWSQFLHNATSEQLETRHPDRDYFSDPEIQRMWVNTYGQWSFTKTTNGLYALVIAPAKEGDIVACLDGAKVPIVLRPVTHESLQNTFQVITIAYVHGFMDQEATQSKELRKTVGLEDQEFWLI